MSCDVNVQGQLNKAQKTDSSKNLGTSLSGTKGMGSLHIAPLYSLLHTYTVCARLHPSDAPHVIL
jgi:hypothetical protein